MSTRRGRHLFAAISVTLCAAAASAGGHMVYIPQFYVIPGQKPTQDEVCVTADVVAGAKSRSQNGDIMEITSIGGKSPMCRDKDKAFLAHVLLTPASDFTSALKIGLPPGFRELPISDRNRFYGERFEAEDPKRHLHVWIKSWRRDHAASFNTWIQRERGGQVDGNERTQSRTETFELNGIEGRRWDLIDAPAKGLFAKRKAWVVTYLKGDKELVRIEVALNADDLEKVREEITSIAEHLEGLRADPAPSETTESTPTPPAS
jgi:hypothetical protein